MPEMKARSLDAQTQIHFEELYWLQGYSLDSIAHHLGKSRSTIQEIFAIYNIPTNVTLIRNFSDYVESDKVDFYLRGYMNFWNRYSYDSSSNKVDWKVVSENKQSLRILQKYLKRTTTVTGTLSRYRKKSYILVVNGLRKCGYLSDYFDLDWENELKEKEATSPWHGRKFGQGEAIKLVVSFTNEEWQSAASIAEFVGYDVRYTSKVLGRAVEKGYLEKRPINQKKYEYRRFGDIRPIN